MHSINVYVPAQSYISINIYIQMANSDMVQLVLCVCVVHQLSGLGGSIFLNVTSSSWL